MSLRCSSCARKAMTSVSRSHSNIATRRKQKLNLQTKAIDGKRVKICTRCLRTRLKQGTSS